MPKMTVHEITIEPDSDKGTGPLYVNLANGVQVVIWPSGHEITLRIPMYDGQEHRYAEAIDIAIPTADDIAGQCDRTDEEGNFTLTATHRH